MADIQEKFAKITKAVRDFNPVVDDTVFATFYSLYKQATVGDNPNSSPTANDSRSVTKHKAWLALKGMSKETAMEAYIKQYEKHRSTYGK